MSGPDVAIDAALRLRELCDVGQPPPLLEAQRMLEASPLVQRLMEDFIPKPLFAVWRLLALAEIPFAGTLGYTAKVKRYVDARMRSGEGFTLTGQPGGLLPCYNAMLLEAYAKLGWQEEPAAMEALGWIKAYQVFERGGQTAWKGKGIQKHGGCMKAVPCYIGIAKTTKALAYWQQATGGSDTEAAALLDKGMEYLLRHRLYKRLRDGEPIYSHILDLAFPSSYQLNVVELLETAHRAGALHRPECADALGYVQSKRTKEGYWKINHVYKAEGYVPFDRRGSRAQWLTCLLNHILGNIRLGTEPYKV